MNMGLPLLVILLETAHFHLSGQEEQPNEALVKAAEAAGDDLTRDISMALEYAKDVRRAESYREMKRLLNSSD